MNELMLVFEGWQWMYFPTDAQTVKEAFAALEKIINLDNMKIVEVKLRKGIGGDPIDTAKC